MSRQENLRNLSETPGQQFDTLVKTERTPREDSLLKKQHDMMVKKRHNKRTIGVNSIGLKKPLVINDHKRTVFWDSRLGCR